MHLLYVNKQTKTSQMYHPTLGSVPALFLSKLWNYNKLSVSEAVCLSSATQRSLRATLPWLPVICPNKFRPSRIKRKNVTDSLFPQQVCSHIFGKNLLLFFFSLSSHRAAGLAERRVKQQPIFPQKSQKCASSYYRNKQSVILWDCRFRHACLP